MGTKETPADGVQFQRKLGQLSGISVKRGLLSHEDEESEREDFGLKDVSEEKLID